MRPTWYTPWRAAAVALDAAMVGLGLTVAAVARFGVSEIDPVGPETRFLVAPIALGVVVWVGAFAAARLYNPLRCASGLEEARRLVTGGLGGAAGLLLVGFALKEPPSRIWLVSGTVLSILAAGMGRRALRAGVTAARRRGWGFTRAVLVGGREAKALADQIGSQPEMGIAMVATCGFAWSDLPQVELDGLPGVVERERASAVILVGADLTTDEVRGATASVADQPVTVLLIPELEYMLVQNVHVLPVGAMPALALEVPSLRVYQRVMKRLLDVLLASALLVLLVPMLALVALAVRLDSPGPVLFRQRRKGRSGHEFELLKFRTMVEGAEDLRPELAAENETDGALFKIRQDPRVTRVGRWLRRTSFDELPQLVNVLKGDMSLVGPRPLPASDYEVEGQDRALARRLTVRPGVTGMWQVSGRSELPFSELVRLDLIYIQNWSIVMDLYILVRTIPAVIRGRGAY
ncbi:MAG TPA: sugar transferase [Actinomycetota bacterium]|nr:sugar transferase [Actinomycetota bacterium]